MVTRAERTARASPRRRVFVLPTSCVLISGKCHRGRQGSAWQPGLRAWRPLPYRGELDVDGVMAGQELLSVPELGQMLLCAASRHHLIEEQCPRQRGVHRDDCGQLWEPGGRDDGESQGLKGWAGAEGARMPHDGPFPT